MNQIWLRIFMVMIGGSVAKYIVVNPFIWVCIDLAILGIAYLILRRYPFIDLKSSMSFLGGLTAVSVLIDLGIISGLVGNILIIALLAWMIFGRSRGSNNRPVNRHKWHK
ncbi:MAG: hypothetical protein H6Q69_4457 [Firmicutes bacterium]|jgi:hypothetical protein|uniref:Uncharacterized protein n=2 Tax=Pelosinus TaxID=365348 RepID=I8U049_9FIRM|nr:MULTISPECIES: hypothetical protein [Pelosinus]AJQ28108.1 hypothetical protein JBW_02764 [Pelosinus fermentans JBW45]MBP2661425.1 hypothetical protein [Bacillota bacterium]MCC5464870.1 hypothetical protein [Pelosinus baikalensis]